MWRDLRYAIQGLWRSPVFTIAATLALGIAIGANATIFGLIDGLWFRPPGVRDPGSLAWVFSTGPTTTEGVWSFPEYLTLRDRTTVFDGVIARGRRGTFLDAAEFRGADASRDGRPQLVLVNVVTTNFFTTLGVAAAHGRVFSPADDAFLEAAPAVVLGHAFWQRRFGADPSIVGRTLHVSRGKPVAVTVAGVLPATFRDLSADEDRDLWMPPQTWLRLAGRAELDDREYRWFNVLARTKPGVPVRTAQAEVATVVAAMQKAFPGGRTGWSARVVSDVRYRLDVGGVNAKALLALVLLVVLITCVNVANLLLARAAARTRELAVRVAIGATRWRLLRQLMTESALLGVLGAVAGVTIAMWLIRLLPAILVEPPGYHSFLVFEADGRMLTFTLIVTVLTTLLFGTVPSWVAARGDVTPLVKGDAPVIRSRGDRAMRHALVTVQIAVSLVLLCAAGVLVRSFIQTGRADLGFTRAPVLTAWGAADAPRAVTMDAMQRLAALPGVRHVALAFRAPLSLSGGGRAEQVYLPDRPPAPNTPLPDVKYNAVTASYFETMGTRLVRGRVFTSVDEGPGEPVIVVSEEFARRFFPGRDAVGAIVRLGGTTGTDHRIVGIVGNAVVNRIGEPPQPYFYVPYWRNRGGDAAWLIEASGDAAALAPAVRDVLKRADPRLEPQLLVTMAQYIDYSASQYQSTAALAAGLGIVGLLLTAIGVYGAIAYQTARRTREIGIRIALGARRGEVLRLILGEGARVGLIGLAIGIPASLLATSEIASLLFGVSAWDPVSFIAAPAVLLGALSAATAIPAWRATRVSPSTALRDV